VASTREQIIIAAEPVFDRRGFAGTGVDRLTEAADVSSRTLYKHLGSKAGLIAAVLDARRERFLRLLDVTTVDELFGALESWIGNEGARGCLFLRAWGEDGESQPEIATAVAAYRDQLRGVMARVIERETGTADDLMSEQLLVLFEGATSAASYRGTCAVEAARTAAAQLLSAHS